MEWITKLDKAFAKAEEILLALILVSMVVLAAIQVLLRNIWSTGIDWADITVQNATVLLGLLGAAVATSEGRHLNIDLLGRVLTGKGRTFLKVAIGIFAVYICAQLTIGGWTTFMVNYLPWKELVPASWTVWMNLKAQFLEGSIPQWLSQLLLPIGFGLIGFHFLLRLIRDLHTLATGKEWESLDDAGPQGDELLDQLEAEAAETFGDGKGGAQ